MILLLTPNTLFEEHLPAQSELLDLEKEFVVLLDLLNEQLYRADHDDRIHGGDRVVLSWRGVQDLHFTKRVPLHNVQQGVALCVAESDLA